MNIKNYIKIKLQNWLLKAIIDELEIMDVSFSSRLETLETYTRNLHKLVSLAIDDLNERQLAKNKQKTKQRKSKPKQKVNAFKVSEKDFREAFGKPLKFKKSTNKIKNEIKPIKKANTKPSKRSVGRPKKSNV